MSFFEEDEDGSIFWTDSVGNVIPTPEDDDMDIFSNETTVVPDFSGLVSFKKENASSAAITPFGAVQLPKAGLVQPQQTVLPEFVKSHIPTIVETPKSHKVKATSVAHSLLRHSILLCIGNAMYLYNGRYYQMLTREELNRYIYENCRDSVESVGNASIIEGINDILFAEPRIAHRPAEPNPDVVVFQNGVLNLHTMQLMPHSPNIWATSMVNANYLVDGRPHCPNFDAFLHTVVNGNPALIARIWEIIGYILTHDIAGKCFFVFRGVPDSGKSTLIRVIAKLFDDEFVTALDLNSLDERFALSDLIGKRLCVDADLPSGVLSDKAVSQVKKLTGGDRLNADVKYAPRVSFFCEARMLFGSNHSLTTSHYDAAFYNRMVEVPFTYTVPKERQVPNLVKILLSERDSIVTKAMGHYVALRDRSYNFSGSDFVAAARVPDQLLGLDKCIETFVTRCCRFNPEASTPTEDLYSAFDGLFPKMCSRNRFTSLFEALCFIVYPGTRHGRMKRMAGGNFVHCVDGIELIDPHSPALVLA